MGIPPLYKGSVRSAMGKAADRGRVLLQSPVVFQPVVLCSFIFQFGFALFLRFQDL